MLFLVLLSLHLPVAVVLSDACRLSDDIDDDVFAHFKDHARIGAVLAACLDDTELVDTLGIRNELSSLDSVSYSSRYYTQTLTSTLSLQRWMR